MRFVERLSGGHARGVRYPLEQCLRRCVYLSKSCATLHEKNDRRVYAESHILLPSFFCFVLLFQIKFIFSSTFRTTSARLAKIKQGMHGDHLYKKGDFEGAMQQYQCTVGHLDPSYVIRRFLDAQRIGLLTSYLETLHDKGQASSDHTTLLLNCHTKLKVMVNGGGGSGVGSGKGSGVSA